MITIHQIMEGRMTEMPFKLFSAILPLQVPRGGEGKEWNIKCLSLKGGQILNQVLLSFSKSENRLLKIERIRLNAKAHQKPSTLNPGIK